MRQEWVARRFPFLVFDPVQNAGQRGLPFAQPVIKPKAEFRRCDFARVTRTDRRDGVAISDAGLEAVEQAVEFHAVQVEIIRRQVRQFIARGRKQSLIGQVVDCEAGAGTVPPPYRQLLVLHKERHQPAHPLEEMDELLLPVQVMGKQRNGLREKNETLGIVGIIHPGVLIQPGAQIKFRSCAMKYDLSYWRWGLERPHLRRTSGGFRRRQIHFSASPASSWPENGSRMLQ